MSSINGSASAKAQRSEMGWVNRMPSSPIRRGKSQMVGIKNSPCLDADRTDARTVFPMDCRAMLDNMIQAFSGSVTH